MQYRLGLNRVGKTKTAKKESQLLPSLKQTASLHLKMDGWNTNFLLGPGLFSGAKMLVSGSVILVPRAIESQALTPTILRLNTSTLLLIQEPKNRGMTFF